VTIAQVDNLLGDDTGIAILGHDVVEPLGPIFLAEFPHWFTERTILLTSAGETEAIVSKVPADIINLDAIGNFFIDFGVDVSFIPHHPTIPIHPNVCCIYRRLRWPPTTV